MLRKVTPADAPQISDPIMTALLQMLSSSTGKSGGVQEDALLAVSTLIEGMCSVTHRERVRLDNRLLPMSGLLASKVCTGP